ncbi:uncharacterized protein LOC132725549 [Ruditapes philippinarum]|uniref:uncharacterized protein LOC132725549 n=1 Tax=Ruditapes philippinarum TaxID=129788 RepID=UPI00295BAB7D|nr:uncharacterized protein LOC132725549 [Ruditapes philippinarum]
MAFFKRKLFKKVPKHEVLQDLPASAEPWRSYNDLNDGWKENYYLTLLSKIGEKTTKVLNKPDVSSDTVNIMLLGYVQSGKSSTINSFYSILDKEICKRAKSGESTTSFTQKYTSYKLEDKLDKIVLYDIMGIELGPNQGVLVKDIQGCIVGDIKHDYKFNPCAEHKSTSDKDLERKEIHCVMYCVDAESVDEDVIPGFETKMQDIESELRVASQDRIVLVTKIDAVCPETKADITQIFQSTKVKTVVEKAASVFRVPVNQVFPIKNYTNEMETDGNKNIPLLLALKKAVDFGTDYLRQRLDEKHRVYKGDKQESTS